MSRSARRLLPSIAALLMVVSGSTFPAVAMPEPSSTPLVASATVAPQDTASDPSTRPLQLDPVVTEPASSLVVFVVAGAVIAGAAFMGRRGRRG